MVINIVFNSVTMYSAVNATDVPSMTGDRYMSEKNNYQLNDGER